MTMPTVSSTRRHRLPAPLVGLGLLLSMAATASSHAQASDRPGIGAIPFESGSASGTTFRTWAPFATSVRVAGSFNGWNQNATLLYPEGDGWWSRDVANVGPGVPYKYVVVGGGETMWRADPRGRLVTPDFGNSVVYDPDAFEWSETPFTMPVWDDLVMMEVHPGTFGLDPGEAPPATFDECIERLDHLADLGINAIALMPVAEFPGDISWGYNPTGLYAVEHAYGGPDALKRFVDAAHERGIAVFGDVVYNHWGPMDMDLWRFDGWSEGPWGGIFFYNDERAVTPWGDTRPDYGRGEVRDFIKDNVRMWLEEFRLDGLRFDATKFVRRTNWGDLAEGWSLLREMNDMIDALQPWKISIAEDMDGDSWITRPTGNGGAGFDSQWDPVFMHPMRSALIAPNDADRDMGTIASIVAGTTEEGDASKRVIYVESHDEAATGGRIPFAIDTGDPLGWWSRKRATLGISVLMTSPGLPMLLQGQEFLQGGGFSDTQPLAWNQAEDFAGIVDMTRDLIALRRNLAGRTAGLSGNHINILHVNHDAKVMAFQRWNQGGFGDDTVVVLNFGNTAYQDYRIGMPHGGTWRLRFNGDATIYDPEFTDAPAFDAVADGPPYDGMPQSMSFGLGPYSALVFSRPKFGSPDITRDGVVNGADLAEILSNWNSDDPFADLNDDGTVNGTDLSMLIASWSAKGKGG
ncbi:MAG: alpha-amylase family glycosyl hydrolase [Planctomycetota bacterium]|jgi:1,4-alpha-glucan branching enzyme